MSQLVQSACPGCKHVLRIPAEWLAQPIRCKHCGMVMSVKGPAKTAPSAPARPAAPSRTPMPATKKPPAPTPPVAKLVTPAMAPVAKLVPPSAAPVAKVVPSNTGAAPMAIPVGARPPGSPFSGIEQPEDSASAPPRRRNRGVWWKAPVLLGAFLVMAGVIAFLNRDRIVDLLPPLPNEPVAVASKDAKDPDPDPITEPREKPEPKKPATTAKAPPPVKTPPRSDDPPPKKSPPPRKETPRDNPRPVTPPKKEPPNADPPRKVPPKVDPPRPAGGTYPRRALVISVHDYLYANPIQNGPPNPNAHNYRTFLESLNRGLNIPLNQVTHLSDVAESRWGGARAPTKTVIEKTLTSFLDSSRTQDRILVFFVGHSIELEDGVYLAPIEGELDKADTLIPLKWFYDQMAKCKARQKVLVLDVNRYNPTFGQERPGGDEMGPKLDEMLKAPPAGVQVWSACIAKQRSYATDQYPMGLFLEEMQTVFDRKSQELPNLVPAPDQPLPLDPIVARVNEHLKTELSKRKLEQESRLTGKEAESDLAFNRNEPAAPDAASSLAGAPEDVAINKALIEKVFDQIGTPPVKVGHELSMRYDALPPFPVEALQKYQGDMPKPDSPLRKAVKRARAMLWAIYPGGTEPKDLTQNVTQLRTRIRFQLNVLKDGYRAPPQGGNEMQFKARVENDEKAIALIMSHLSDTLEELESNEVVEARETESKRWKANYDFIKARVTLEYAYLFEYQSALGSIRKEFPPRDPAIQGGWKLSSVATPQGDSAGKKFYKSAQKLLDKIVKENAGSPWEVLAKREKLINIGLEWQATR